MEQAAADRKGAFVLAKVNVDEAQQLAGYFRIESIPAVLAFKGGQPVNGFVGLVAERRLKQFLDDLAGPAANDPLVQAAALEETRPEEGRGDLPRGLAKDEKNDPARLGLARVLVATDRDDEALKVAGDDPRRRRVRGRGGQAAAHGRDATERRHGRRRGGANKKIAADPENANSGWNWATCWPPRGSTSAALDALLKAAELDRELGRGPVRELMVKVFEIVGVRSELADRYRDQLRAMLY